MIKYIFIIISLVFILNAKEIINIENQKNLTSFKSKTLGNSNIFILDKEIALLTIQFNPKYYQYNDNIKNENEKLFQVLIDTYQYLLRDFNFKTQNKIILSLFNNKKIYKNIGLSINIKYLKLQNNRDYNNSDFKLSQKYKSIPPLFPIKQLFANANIVKIDKSNNGLIISKNILTKDFKTYLDKHMFNNALLENQVEDEYNNYYKIKKKDIYLCCATNDMRCIKQYIKYKFDINIQDKKGRTPLIIATFRNQYDVVKYLLENGANPNLYADGSENAFLLAERKKLSKIAKLLKPLTKLTVRPKISLSKYEPSDLKNMCLGGSGKHKTFCYNINNTDLKSSCLGFASYQSECYNIQDNDLKNLCLAPCVRIVVRNL